MRSSMRLSAATPALRSGIACCTATAQRTALTTLANSARRPSPVVLTMVLGDLLIQDLAAQCLEPFERAFPVGFHHPRIPRDVCGEDRGETAGGGHSSGNPALRRPSIKVARNSDETNLPQSCLLPAIVGDPGYRSERRLTHSRPSSTRPSWPQAAALTPITEVILG